MSAFVIQSSLPLLYVCMSCFSCCWTDFKCSKVFDDFEPSFVITPYYPASNTTVELGNRVKPEAVSSRPDLYMSMVKPTETVKANGTYTLVLSDPDATSQADPAKAQMCHWILTNMTLPESNVQHAGSVNLGSVLTLSGNEGIFELESYAPPAPPPKTGYHRYVFALLTSDSIPERPKDRPHWGYGKIGTGIREWAADNDMTVVGKSGG